MPELPEVETVRRTLAPAVGLQVVSVWTSGMPLRLNHAVEDAVLRRELVGRCIEGVRRWGKYLLVDVAGASVSMMVHLGMSGRLRLMAPDTPRPAHTHVVLALAHAAGPAGGARPDPAGRALPVLEMRYSDPRRFGMVTPVPRGAERTHPSLARLGLDPLESELTGALIHERTRGLRRGLKTFLLDQRVIAGIGNIYASEALWQARIRPDLEACRLSRPRADALAVAVRVVLERALTNGGTSLRDFVDADGHQGNNAHYLWVYDREGQPCMRPECGRPIRRTVIQGRSTFHCPACQRR